MPRDDLEIRRERTRTKRLGQQRGHDPQHPLIGRRQAQVAGPEPDDHLADGVFAERQRQAPRVRDGHTGARQLLATHHETGEREDHRLAHCSERFDGIVADAVRDLGCGVERIWPAAEEELVDDGAEPVAGADGTQQRRRRR